MGWRKRGGGGESNELLEMEGESDWHWIVDGFAGNIVAVSDHGVHCSELEVIERKVSRLH